MVLIVGCCWNTQFPNACKLAEEKTQR
jgi:hypothetical protein